MYPDIEKVRKALNDCEALPLDIYTETGLTPAWQQAVACGRTGDPGYTKIVTLVEYLNREHPTLLAKD